MQANTDQVLVTIAQRIADPARAVIPVGKGLVVGLCGPQGSGKSTMLPLLKQLLEEFGVSVAALSLDDFYLPRAEREALARTVHPLLRTRGVPGTHDIDLALRIFVALRKEGSVSVPTFDKALDDRRPRREWTRVQAPVDVILLEGWCVGAVPQAQESLSEPTNALESNEDPQGIWRRYVNDALAGIYQALYGQIDFLIMLAIEDFGIVHRWRLQQENDLRGRVAAERGDASRLMSNRELERFISHYERLTRHLLEEMPKRADVVVWLDDERRKKIGRSCEFRGKIG